MGRSEEIPGERSTKKKEKKEKKEKNRNDNATQIPTKEILTGDISKDEAKRKRKSESGDAGESGRETKKVKKTKKKKRSVEPGGTELVIS